MTALNPEQLRWSILIASLAMLVMAAFVIMFIIYYQRKRLEQEKNLRDVEKNYQRMLLDTALNSEETERRRIAQDLHDDIGTMLSLTKLCLNQLHKNMHKEDSLRESSLRKAQSLVEETIIHVRRITRDLVPTTLEQFGLVAAIEEFIHRLSDTLSLTVHFQYDADTIPRLAPKVELALYRIMQELVNNAIKHANCDEIDIDLHLDNGKLELQVTDNGKGFDLSSKDSQQSGGLGLRTIESRLTVINGAVQYQKPGVRGMRARVQIPVEPEYPGRPEPLHPFRKSPAGRSV